MRTRACRFSENCTNQCPPRGIQCLIMEHRVKESDEVWRSVEKGIKSLEKEYMEARK